MTAKSPAKKRARPVIKRDADGLMLDQRRVLQALANGAEPHAACRQEDISWSRFRGWIAQDEKFIAKYDSLFSTDVEAAKNRIEMLSTKAADVLSESFDSEKLITIEVTCPCECGFTFETQVNVADFTKQRWAADTTLKVSRILRDVKDLNVDVTVTKLDLEDRIALARAKAGMPIPPHIKDKLRKGGHLGAEDAVEGEYREITVEDPE